MESNNEASVIGFFQDINLMNIGYITFRHLKFYGYVRIEKIFEQSFETVQLQTHGFCVFELENLPRRLFKKI
ncbi:hypothetical protein HZS_7416 [Henneguya salminicola]|nr:hypothetical protein HZS_7416 [Henneguya salminicola]